MRTVNRRLTENHHRGHRVHREGSTVGRFPQGERCRERRRERVLRSRPRAWPAREGGSTVVSIKTPLLSPEC